MLTLSSEQKVAEDYGTRGRKHLWQEAERKVGRILPVNSYAQEPTAS